MQQLPGTFIIGEDDMFVLYEIWKDADVLETHIESPHDQQYRHTLANIISAREVYRLKAME